MTAPDGLPPLRETIANLGLSARKSLGQNFILDLNLTTRIARAGGALDGKTVIEIGPGPGGLTRGLFLEGAAHVIVVERDERCRPALEAIAERYPGRLDIHMDDALNIDYDALGDGRKSIVSNLPYGIATPLLVGWLKTEPWPPWFDDMVLMFQREVAERITARPSTKAYGRLSVLAQWRTVPSIVLPVPAAAFTPRPKVDSAVVRFIPKAAPSPACDAEALERVTAAAFGQRRKMLRTSLRQIFDNPEARLSELGIEPTCRAEELSVEAFCRMAELLSA